MVYPMDDLALLFRVVLSVGSPRVPLLESFGRCLNDAIFQVEFEGHFRVDLPLAVFDKDIINGFRLSKQGGAK